jgi:dTDP-4-amino-4,6-dideoxygalactose transaminase
MPDPWSTGQVELYERELAGYFDVDHVIAVSSGTASLHCALRALAIGPGDEVLVPAVSVVMSVAPILYVGAVPVFVDCRADGITLDLDDLAVKITDRSRAVLPVHLWGRTGDVVRLVEFARAHGLWVIEDACQAIGTRFDGQLAGTLGDLGCFSTRDGKILWSGEGGFILTHDVNLAERCRALRTHWQTPPRGQQPLMELGHSYRLAEPLAAIALRNLAQIDGLLTRRRHQAQMLVSLLADTPGLFPLGEDPEEEWNWFAPLFRIGLARPREFSAHLTALGVHNSVGSHGLTAADRRLLFARYVREPCLQARTAIDVALAVVLSERDTDDCIQGIASTITREAARWAAT